jgi:type IV pilus assembly protein PilY1
MMQLSRACRALAAVAATTFLLATAPSARAAVDLADAPLFSSVSVPGNLLLALSVEYPTASTYAYPSSTAYATASTYLGYFDPAKCYTYNYVSSAPTTSYFVPNGAASSHVCSGSTLWSGNWLNWAGMQSLDEFRWVLTGGNRLVDSSTQTILQKTYHSGQDGSSAPTKSIGSTLVSGATAVTSWSSVYSRISGVGIKMLISNCSSISTTATDYQPGMTTSTNCNSNAGTNYALYMNVQVCASAALKEDNCVLYGTVYKPEGLMQEYASQLRYSAMGYLNDGTVTRDGGVLRAGMKYIAPTQPVPGSAAITNSLAEWSSSTGIMVTNPNSSDASATTTAAKTAGAASTFSITQSGVMNYLNKFGYNSSSYKTYDPVSELYYAGIRYYKNLGNVAAYSSLSGGTSSTIPTWLDGFPVVTSWTDPIAYSCQKNFILGIGDVNTHRDTDLPGSTLYATAKAAGQEPTTPTEVTNDTTVDVAAATNMVGKLESGTTTLAATWVSSGRYDGYYIAGLAYDAHTKDIRSDLSDAQTISTYWLDVLEGQTYASKNEYYYATKYGGFTIPDTVQPYGGTNSSKITIQPYSTSNATNTLKTDVSTTKLDLSIGATASTTSAGTVIPISWHTNSDRCTGTSLCSSSNTSGDYRPDNYFTAADADGMKTSLTTAFENIASQSAAANGTALSTPSVNTTSANSVSYGATYDPNTWTGQVTASLITFSATDGTPTLTQAWDARALLSATSVTASTRKIVTCCTSSTTAPGVAFTTAGMTGSTVISRTSTAYSTYFAQVPSVSTANQSSANFLAYLRGDTTKELANGGRYRDRSYRLGDIVNSKTYPVLAPNQPYYDGTNAGYTAFKAAMASRATVVYVGANDGMLHAFDGSTGASTSGQELFAYIPSFVYGDSTNATTSGLATLGNPTSFTHHYFVDSTPAQFDVDLVNTYATTTAKATISTRSACVASSTSTTTNWCTLLIGGLGKGGKGYYALDITDPTKWTSESAVASKVMWEFTDTHMGYTYGTPSLVKTKKWGWVVVMTSGYNNDDGIGYFYFVSPSTGALLERVATSTTAPTTPINLAQHTAFVPDYTDGTADAIYGADLQGNIWRLDVTGTGTYAAPTLIATLKDASGNAQPVTTRPLIETDTSSAARYVLVGTGRLLGDSDISSSLVQSFYAIIDGTALSGGFYTTSTLPAGVTFPVVRSELNKNTNLLAGITAAAGTIGWYYDMSVTSGIAERVDVDPAVTSGTVAWAGNTPNGSACSPSGTGNTYAVAFATGKTVLWDSTTNSYVSSIADTKGVITEVSFLSVNGTTYLYSGDSSGAITNDTTKIGSTSGVKQLNWRDVPLGN